MELGVSTHKSWVKCERDSVSLHQFVSGTAAHFTRLVAVVVGRLWPANLREFVVKRETVVGMSFTRIRQIHAHSLAVNCGRRPRSLVKKEWAFVCRTRKRLIN